MNRRIAHYYSARRNQPNMHGHIFAGAESIATIANSETSDVFVVSQ